ncbi:MAG TPA: glutathione S-transferase family protein [Steroidobacteraceae bacterium]
MITLYHRPQTRSSRFLFLLEELGAPYEVQIVSTRSRDGTGVVDPGNPHPHGKVPAIADDGVVVFESAAITLYLTDKFPQNRIGPMAGDAQRGAYLSWLAYYAGVFEPALISKFMKVEVPRVTAGWVAIEEVMAVILARLAAGPFWLGQDFSGLDVLFGTTFAQFAQSDMMPRSPLLDAYVKRVVARPAFARAMAKDKG